MITRKTSQHGFVLPLALIILAILTGLAMSLSEQARNKLQDIQRRQTEWQNELAYRSVVQQVVQILLTGEAVYNRVRLDNVQLPIDGQTVTISGLEVQIQDGAGLLGLGWYRDNWMNRLLRQLTTPKQANRISDELADWIDTDNIRRRYGMEALDYLSAGKKYQPRNVAIRHLDELLELPSMTAELYNGNAERFGLRDLLLAGGSDHLNVATAAAPVLQAVLDVPAQQLQKILAARQNRNWPVLEKLIPEYHEAYGDYGPFAPGNLYRITLRKKDSAALTAVIRLTPTRSTPYEIVTWYYPDNERGWI